MGGERHARRPRPRDRAPDFLLHRADNNIVVNGKVADTGGHAAPLEIGRRGAEHAQIVRQPLHLQDRDRAADRNKWLCRAGFDDVRRLFDGFEMDRDVGVEHPIMAEQRRKAGAPTLMVSGGGLHVPGGFADQRRSGGSLPQQHPDANLQNSFNLKSIARNN